MVKLTNKERAKLDAPPKLFPPMDKPTNPFLYVVVFAILGLASMVTVLVLRPESDIVVVVGVVGGLMTSVIFTFLGYIKNKDTLEMQKKTLIQTQETHELVNSRTTESLAIAIKAAMAEGRRLGRLESEARTDKLAKQAKA